MEQSDEEVAEMIARFRTPPGFSWEPLRDDILTLLKSRPRPEPIEAFLAMAGRRQR